MVLEHNTGQRDWDFPEEMLKEGGVFELEVANMSNQIIVW